MCPVGAQPVFQPPLRQPRHSASLRCPHELHAGVAACAPTPACWLSPAPEGVQFPFICQYDLFTDLYECATNYEGADGKPTSYEKPSECGTMSHQAYNMYDHVS